MKRTTFTISALLMMAVVLTSCSSDSIEPTVPQEKTAQEQEGNKEKEPATEPEEPTDNNSMVVDMLPTTKAIELTAAQREFVNRNIDFSFNFYRALNAAQGEKKSIISSPLSVSYVLGMLNAGAKGETATEIMKVLGYGTNAAQDINTFCKSLMEQAVQVDPSVTLKVANGLVANRWFELEDAFVKDMQDFYHAEVSVKDFAQTATLDYINSWSNKQTEGMVPQIVESLDPSTAMVLMNAVFFKATWSEKFDEADTRDGFFTREDGSSITLPMMQRKALIQYSENDVYRTIYLPYGGKADNLNNGFDMAVLLPKDGKTVEDIVNSLTQESWYKNRWEQRSNVIADIKIPRFSTQSDMTLNGVLSSMGAPLMFTDKADFSLMAKKNANESLFVSLLKQKAAVDVSEEGTKLSAVTVAMMVGANDASYPNVDFNCNRPFVYVVQEASSGAIFFIGTYYGQ